MKDRLSNIDINEVAKFNAMADLWWDSKGEFKALHEINPVRLAYVCRRAGLAGKVVLDVGCGGGLMAEGMAAEGARVTGIDAAAAVLAVARLHANQSGLAIEYRQGSTETWAASHREAYDIVTCMELVEHVPDPVSLVRACAALVRPGGDLFLATVNRTWLAYLLVIVASEYVFKIVRRGTHQYDKFVRPQELAAFGRQAGLVLANLSGLRYVPWIGHVRLCKDTRMNYLMHFQKPGSRG